jgi:hypothetical protein
VIEIIEINSVIMDARCKIEADDEYGHCRCCLAEGNHRDLSKIYLVNNKPEVYSDLLLDCFNIFVSLIILIIT